MAEKKTHFTIRARMQYQLMGVNAPHALASLDSVTDRLVKTHRANGVRVTMMALTPTTQTCASPLSPLMTLKESVGQKAGCQQFDVVMDIKTSDRLALDAACALSGIDVCEEWGEMCWMGLPVIQCEFDSVKMDVFVLVCGGVLLVALMVVLLLLRKRIRLFCTVRKQRHTDRSDAIVTLLDSAAMKMPQTWDPYTRTYESKLGHVHVAPAVCYSSYCNVCWKS